MEIAARAPGAIRDDSLATVVDGEGPDDLGKRLFFVHSCSAA
jgi:hypothetical protein